MLPASECCGKRHPEPQCDDCPMHEWEALTMEIGIPITSIEQMQAAYRKRRKAPCKPGS